MKFFASLVTIFTVNNNEYSQKQARAGKEVSDDCRSNVNTRLKTTFCYNDSQLIKMDGWTKAFSANSDW